MPYDVPILDPLGHLTKRGVVVEVGGTSQDQRTPEGSFVSYLSI